jgi:DNA-binding winged helix-turn-helix (wHTH) protein
MGSGLMGRDNAMVDGFRDDFRLNDWLVQPAQCRLSRDGQTRQVRPKIMDLLTYLAARRGDVVSKDDLLDGVWGTASVSESALTRTVTELRQALGDAARDPRVLETIAKRGYRLIGSVSLVTADVPVLSSRPLAGTNATGWLLFGGVTLAVVGAFRAWVTASRHTRR